jgi:GNAT superfamily N-acetyltransferase
MGPILRPATTDADRVLFVETVQAAARWLEAIGKPMWRTGWLTAEKLAAAHPPEGWRLGWLDGRFLGALTLDTADPTCWPEDVPGDALYLHKLAVAQSAHGHGRDLLTAARRDALDRGYRSIKLDCGADRLELRRLYERNGYVYLDQIQLGPYPSARYGLDIA